MRSSRHSFHEYVKNFLKESGAEPDSVKAELDYGRREGYLEIILDGVKEVSDYPEVEHLGYIMIEELGIEQPTIPSFRDIEKVFYQAKVE